MMIKNIRQKLRTPVGTLLEMLLPLVFVLGLMAIWAATNNGNTPTTQYVDSSSSSIQVLDGLSMVDQLLCNNGTVDVNGIRRCTAADLATANCPTLTKAPVQGLCAVGDAIHPMVNWTDFRKARNVPSFDEIIKWQWLSRMLIDDNTRGNAYGTGMTALSNNGQLWFSPNNANVAGLINYFNETSLLFRHIGWRVFDNVNDARNLVSTNELCDTTWAIIEVGAMSPTTLDVTLHMNRSGVPWTNTIIDVGNGIGSFSTGLYLNSGFSTLQDAIYRYYSERVLNVSAPLPLVHIPMPYWSFDTSSFLVIVGMLASLFLVFGYIYPVSQLVKRIVEEKEQRVREAMMIMGLATAPFYCSWVFTYFIMQLATSLVCAGVLKGTMFPKSDFAIIWALYFTFGLSNITFSSMISSFFSKSRIAALVAPVIFFVCAVPSFAMPSTTPAGILIGLSILSPTAFANGMNVLVQQELTGGMKNTTINDSFNGYPMSVAIFMLVLDTVVYMLLTLYLDYVLPSEWGTHAHPCFCFVDPFRWLRRRMNPRNEDEEADGRDPNGEFEAVTPGLKPSVMLRGLRKEFDLPNGEHKVAVNNLTIDLYENQVFALLGHNGAGKTTAMNLMTGMLEMDAGDCYFHGYSVKHDLQMVRREIGYCPQHNILWPELTCREHLHFFARLKGLDSEKREAAVEAVLKAVDLENKAEKFPTELSGGQKRKLSIAIAFVGGSRVVFLDEPTAGLDVEARRHTWDLIKSMSPGRTIVLTTHYMEEADLLGNTVAIMSKGRLRCAGSSVFLKSRLGVGYNFTVTCDHGTANTAHIVDAVKQFVPDTSVLSDASGEVTVRLPMSAVPQFPALLSYFESNSKQLGVRGHGISVTTLEEVFLKLGHDEELEIAAAQEKAGNTVIATPKELIWTNDIADAHASPMGQSRALMVKRFHYARRDTRTIVMQVVLPVVAILFAMLLTLIKFPDCPKLTIEPSMYANAVDSVYGNCPPNWNMYTVNGTTSINSGASNSVQLSQYLLDTFFNHAHNRVSAYECSDSTVASGPATTFSTNTSIYQHSAPQALWEVHTPYMRRGTSSQIANSISSFPIPLSPREWGFINGITGLFIALFVMIPLTFVPSTFVSFVVKERETRALQLQQASGLNYLVYWCSNYIFDLLSFFITALLILIIFAIFGRNEYVGDAAIFFATLFLFMFYGMASVSSSYVMSFFFDSHSTAQNIVMLVNFICGFMLVLLAYILTIIPSTTSAGQALKWIFRLVPSYCLGEGILNLANRSFEAGYASAPGPWDVTVVGWPILYLALEAPFFLAITLYLDSPLRRSQQHAISTDSHGPAESISDEDEDVKIERQEIESGQRAMTDVVTVHNLRKVYHGRKSNVAVKNLSFGVHRGEVFGFLGTNGAGKTTTISILCGEHMPSRGKCFVGGFDVVSEAGQARKLIGYCPQFDATHDLLTVDEHLNLYSSLHGIDGKLQEEVVERLIAVCDLTDHRTQESRNLSGGNRRKLSVAISLIGAPQIVFLDEPSAGMDPKARRGLFDVIAQISKHCAVVLTTHHLEEVEAISNRVGIMVEGELRCLGPLGHLKSKFGAGFEMTARVNKENQVDAAIAFITEAMDGAVIQERRGGKITVALPQHTKLSTVFEQLEANKVRYGISDYSIAQTSLESVFLHIADEKKDDAE